MATLREKLRSKGFESAGDFIAVGLMIFLPLLAVGLITYFIIITTTPDLLPLWAAILVGVIGGTLAVVMGIATSGTDMMDVIVTSVIIIILTIIMLPVGIKAKENRLRKKQNAVSTMKKQQP
jgi:peptidoglycan/LPS O-acetylase OafA/YrhL